MGREQSEITRRRQEIFPEDSALQARSVFSDETEFYRIPMQPAPYENCTIRIRTMKDAFDEVLLVSDSWRIHMSVSETVGEFDFYEITLRLRENAVRYSFELRIASSVYYYDKLGITQNYTDAFRFRIVPGFLTPTWSHGAVMYQIYVDRFYNGDKSNDVEDREYAYLDHHSHKVENWDKLPEKLDVFNFYGGDLEGVRQKLDYLQDLGVEVLYMSPLFISPSNHKYDIQDYSHIDPHFGKIMKDGGNLLASDDMDNRNATKYITRTTNPQNLKASDKLFEELCGELHNRGMRIILDGVFNHCGDLNKWLNRGLIYNRRHGCDKGAFVDENSRFRLFFEFIKKAWPHNEFYVAWWGLPTLPKLNYEKSPQLIVKIMNIGKKWVSGPFWVNGWRLDVAADVGQSASFNHKFWRWFRKVVKKANPDALILAEHYGDAEEWLQGDQWDSIMNYSGFMEPVSWFFTGMEKHSDQFRDDMLGNGVEFENAVRYYLSGFIGASALCAMNELDNHDHSRFLTRTNHFVGRIDKHAQKAADEGIDYSVMRAAVVVQMTFIGAPTLYYGDEAGVTGFTDPDNRRTYPWGHENKELLEFYRTAIRMHKEYEALKKGSMLFLECGNQYISYGRFTDKEQCVIAANACSETIQVNLPVWETGISRNTDVEMVEILDTYENGFLTEPTMRLVTGGTLNMDLRPHEAVVLYHKGNDEV